MANVARLSGKVGSVAQLGLSFEMEIVDINVAVDKAEVLAAVHVEIPGDQDEPSSKSARH